MIWILVIGGASILAFIGASLYFCFKLGNSSTNCCDEGIPIIEGKLPQDMDPYAVTINAAFQSKGAVFSKINDDGTVEMSNEDGEKFVGDNAADAANKLLDR